MASSAAKECGICNEEFDEEFHCPRILPCAHCLCADCINKLIAKNSKECPFCRYQFVAISARDFGRNNNLLDLLKYIAELEGNTKSPLKIPTIPHLRTNEENVHEYVHSCLRAEKHISNAIKTNADLRTNLLLDNRRIKSDILEKINGITAENERKVEDLEAENERLQREVREIQNRMLRARRGPVVDAVQEPLPDLRTWLQDFQGFIADCEDMHEQIGKTAYRSRNKINAIQKVLNTPDEPEEVGTDLSPDMKALKFQEEENTSNHISAERILEMSGPVMNMVTNGMLFAVQVYEGRRRFAKISFTEDNKLCLGHLTEEEPPSKVNIVKHVDVMRLLDRSSRLLFLELGVHGTTLGRMYIRLLPETRIGDQFAYLCTGELGPSYAKSRILDVVKKGHEKKEIVQFGDYEKNDGTGGTALISGLDKEFGEHCMRPWLPGTVGGWWWGWRGDTVAAQFFINTKKNSKQMCDPVIGMVEEGLEILTKAISKYPYTHICIYNCGIVLPSPNFQESAPPPEFQVPQGRIYGFV